MLARWVDLGVAVIDFAGAVIVMVYCVVAIGVVLRERDPAKARHLVAMGAISGLTFKLAATLLHTLVVTSWSQVGMLAFVVGLKTVLKWTFARERGRLPEG